MSVQVFSTSRNLRISKNYQIFDQAKFQISENIYYSGSFSLPYKTAFFALKKCYRENDGLRTTACRSRCRSRRSPSRSPIIVTFRVFRLRRTTSPVRFWITPDNRIFLETFSSKYRAAYEFLIAIAEPISRPAFIHEYELTQYSLYAAMVVQLTPEKIKGLLHILCKNEAIPAKVIDFIDRNTKNYGSVKLFLRGNQYFLQIFDRSNLRGDRAQHPREAGPRAEPRGADARGGGSGQAGRGAGHREDAQGVQRGETDRGAGEAGQ